MSAGHFELDRAIACRALQDARAYVVDLDRSGRQAKAIYSSLERASRVMRPWSDDGSHRNATGDAKAHGRKATECLREIASILSEKIGPASRREFPQQRTPKKSAAQFKREIDAALERSR